MTGSGQAMGRVPRAMALQPDIVIISATGGNDEGQGHIPKCMAGRRHHDQKVPKPEALKFSLPAAAFPPGTNRERIEGPGDSVS